MSKDISLRFSRKVTIVSFILAVFVMYIHAKNLAYYDFGDAHGTLIYGLNQILSEIFGRIAVPFFFLQSGYWMFRYDIFEKKSDVLKGKMKKKVISLGIPYLLWNTLGLLFFLIVTRLSGMPFNLYHGQIVPITWETIGKGIFLHEFYFPYWFMQDLIVLTVMSPVLVMLLRKRCIAYVTIGILFMLSMRGINTPVFQMNSLLSFFMGGTLSVYHREYWETTNRHHFETVCYMGLFCICAVLKWFSIPYFYTIYIVAAPILFWKCCDCLEQIHIFDHEPLWFCKQSFFIYSAHIFLVEGLSSILSKVGRSMAWASFCYIVTPLIALAFLYVVARIGSQKFPKVYGLLCGNRI